MDSNDCVNNLNNTENIDNLIITYDLDSTLDNASNFEDNYLCKCNKFLIIFKNILLFLFILGAFILLVLILGIISKTLYK